MFFVDILFAVIIGLIMTLIFAVGLRRSGPWSSVLIFFFVVFLAAWAAGKWMRPIGPPLLGFHWLPFFAVGAVIALLLAAALPFRLERARRKVVEPGAEEGPAEKAYDWMLGLFLLALLALILVGYLAPGVGA